ncbi:guanylate-binding protein 1-like isoform X1 [Lepisosteus oculatus]|uniref:guanylate-binding protein 1-like isoform X1 n=1 Tax=Lepisosteus oculatus TaxID=7918 RepID=UPI0035F52B30
MHYETGFLLLCSILVSVLGSSSFHTFPFLATCSREAEEKSCTDQGEMLANDDNTLELKPGPEMENPMELVINRNGKLSVNQEALQVLSEIDRPVVVVAVAGPARTGKSYLLNRLAGRKKGFQLGSTVQSHTKGIWMWCLRHPTNPDHELVLLDTEGFGDPEKGDDDNDHSIFTLGILLSSMFVYNSVGNIDQNSLKDLHFVTKLAQWIQKDTQTNGSSTSDFITFFPEFVWILRDLTLDLVIYGKPVTADQYLEHVLRLKKYTNEKAKKFNDLRRCIREYFPSRNCFGLVTPTMASNLKRLEELQDHEMDPLFVKQFADFSSYVYNTAKAKDVDGTYNVTGRVLGNLVDTYVQALNHGQRLCVESAVERLADIENSAAVEKAVTYYTSHMNSSPVTSLEELFKQNTEHFNKSLEIFLKHSMMDRNHTYYLKLFRALKEKYEDLRHNIETESEKRCTSVLKELESIVKERLTSGYYIKPGGYGDFTADVEDTVKKYNARVEGEVLASKVLDIFLQQINSYSKNIQRADTLLQQAEVKERLKEQQEESKEKARREREVEEKEKMKQKEEAIRMLEEKNEEITQGMTKRAQDIINRKKQEQEDYEKEGSKKDWERMKWEIENYEHHQEEQRKSYFETFKKLLQWVFSWFY